MADRFGRERLVVIPNITSVQALCARVCESWDSIETVSFHGRKGETGIGRLLDILASGRKVAVITDPEHMPQWIARELIESAYSECKLIIGEDLGAPIRKSTFIFAFGCRRRGVFALERHSCPTCRTCRQT